MISDEKGIVRKVTTNLPAERIKARCPAPFSVKNHCLFASPSPKYQLEGFGGLQREITSLDDSAG